MSEPKQDNEAACGRSDSTEVLDAARYRRLAWMVEFGFWSVGQHEVIDRMGCTKDTFMDDKADMDAWLDKPEMIQEAETCAKALKLMGRTEQAAN